MTLAYDYTLRDLHLSEHKAHHAVDAGVTFVHDDHLDDGVQGYVHFVGTHTVDPAVGGFVVAVAKDVRVDVADLAEGR